MSDTSTIPAPFAPLPPDWEAQAAERRGHEARIREINRTAIFDALAMASIDLVVALFDGYGDSGQIQDIEAQGDTPDAMERVEMQLAALPWGKTEPDYFPVTLAKAIEELIFHYLGDLHGGWEDNEGSYGEVRFDVWGRTITLDFNERYVASDHTQHEL